MIQNDRHFNEPLTGSPSGNGLLERLSPSRLAMLAPATMILGRGSVLAEPDRATDQAYFPLAGAVASLVIDFDEGAAVETMMIGNEGALGVFDHQSSAARAAVTRGGQFVVVSKKSLMAARRECRDLDNLLAKYSNCFLAELLQTAACNAMHTSEQRAARRLIGLFERTRQQSEAITQEELADLLGVGRSYMNRLLSAWREKGLVDWRRRWITVLDVERFKHRACRCGDAVRKHFEAVLAGVFPPPLESGDRAIAK